MFAGLMATRLEGSKISFCKKVEAIGIPPDTHTYV